MKVPIPPTPVDRFKTPRGSFDSLVGDFQNPGDPPNGGGKHGGEILQLQGQDSRSGV